MATLLLTVLSQTPFGDHVLVAPRHVLVAGYGPWASHLDNPSAETAAALNNTCYQSVCFTGWNLTVSHAGASRVADALYRGELKRYDAIVTLGLESSAKGLMIELAGTNVRAETDGKLPIDPRRPLSALLPPTIDTARLEIGKALAPVAAAVEAARSRRVQNEAAVASSVEDLDEEELIGSLWSRDAGTFYCNEALYRTSDAIRRLKATRRDDASLLLPFAFVHLPEPSLAPVGTVVAPAIAKLAVALLAADALAAVVQSD